MDFITMFTGFIFSLLVSCLPFYDPVIIGWNLLDFLFSFAKIEGFKIYELVFEPLVLATTM